MINMSKVLLFIRPLESKTSIAQLISHGITAVSNLTAYSIFQHFVYH